MNLLNKASQIDRTQWDSLCRRSSTSSIFQTPQMYDFYQRTGLYRQVAVAVEEEGEMKGVAVAVVQEEGLGLRRTLSRRAIVNGGPLLADNISPEALKALLHALCAQLRHRCTYLECRNLNDYSPVKALFKGCGFEYKPHYNFHIDTSDPAEALRRIDKSRRRRIRRATEAGATVSQDPTALDAFYAILHRLYHDRLHRPLPSLPFFRLLLQEPFAHAFFVRDTADNVIGGQIILTLAGQTAYAWYCCGLDHEYHALYPSIMANYAAIHFAATHRFSRYDMMGAGSPDEDYGVRDFKAQFGGTLVEHGRFLKIFRPTVYRLGSHIMKHLSR